MSTPVELEDFQHELGGVLIGRGTSINIKAIEGLGQPPLRTSDVDPPGEDGTWLGADYYAGRTVRLDAAIKVVENVPGVLDISADSASSNRTSRRSSTATRRWTSSSRRRTTCTTPTPLTRRPCRSAPSRPVA
jgi:hypothetical protein